MAIDLKGFLAPCLKVDWTNISLGSSASANEAKAKTAIKISKICFLYFF